MSPDGPAVVVFDLDGTLLDSDDALVAPFVSLGVPADAVQRGRPLAEECAAHGVEVADVLAAYDLDAAQPFAGVPELLDAVCRWAVCSNKHPMLGHRELSRLGWEPEAGHFAGATDEDKSLAPILEDLGLGPEAVAFVGDTEHDRRCAEAVGCRFVLAAWNPRVEVTGEGPVARHPSEVPDLLRG